MSRPEIKEGAADRHPRKPDPQPTCPVIDSACVLQGRIEVAIVHNGRTYRLRATRLGKLILTA